MSSSTGLGTTETSRLTPAVVKKLLNLFGWSGQRRCIVGQKFCIMVRNPLYKGEHGPGRDIIQVFIIHGMQGINQRLVQNFSNHGAGKTDPEFIVNMDDVGSNCLIYIKRLVLTGEARP